MSVRRALHWIGVAGVVVLGGQYVLTVSPAAAVSGYSNSAQTTFGASGSGSGQFSGPTGVAVDTSTGDVYVVDTGNNRVEKFDAEGKYLSQITGTEVPGGSFSSLPGGIAVDDSSSPAKGDVYVANDNAIDVFDSTGKYLSQIVGNFSSYGLQGLAVDGEGNIWGDSLFVGSETGTQVEELSPIGAFVSQFNALRSSRTNVGLAVDSSNYVYVMRYCGQAINYCIVKYDLSGSHLAEWGDGTAIAVNETTHDVFLDGPNGIEQFGAFGEPYTSPVGVFDSSGTSTPGGIAVNNATGAVYATDKAADTVAIFDVEQLPRVVTGGNSTVKDGATLEGTVDPEGMEVTGCQFEYGTSRSYGHTVSCSSAPGSGTSPVVVTAELKGLASETTYHYRLVAANANGEPVGLDGSFTTPPSVLLGNEPASEIQGTSATLNALFIQGGFDTHDWFEYGLTTAYGSQTPHVDAGPGVGEEIEVAQAHVTGLEPNTTYHSRFAAENEFGVTHAEDATFKTLALPAAIAPSSIGLITRTTAVVSGGLNPEKSPTTFQIVYGETAGYGEHTAAFEVGDGLAEHPFIVGLEGLAPGRTYHYAVAATNQAGTFTSPDGTFTTAAATPPTAITGAASNVTLTTATVSGTIAAAGLETSYEFDLGTDTSYGTSIYGEAGSKTEPIELSLGLEDLAPGATYHYRIVAVNSDGRTYGADQTFTTPVYSNPIVLPSALPLLQTPPIAFPTETQGTTLKKAPAAKKKNKKVKHKGRKARRTDSKTGHRRKRR